MPDKTLEEQIFSGGNKHDAFRHIDEIAKQIQDVYGIELKVEKEYIHYDGKLPEMDGKRFSAEDSAGARHFFDIYADPRMAAHLFKDISQEDPLFLVKLYGRMQDIELNHPDKVTEYGFKVQSWVQQEDDSLHSGAYIEAGKDRVVNTLYNYFEGEDLKGIDKYFREWF